MARSEDERYLTLEDQLAQYRQQVVEERESRAAAEKATADRAAKQQQQHDDVMQALARLGMPREEQTQGDQAQVASITGGEVGNPASPSQVLPSPAQGEGVVPAEVCPRADRFGESGQHRHYGLTGESARYVSRISHVPPMKISPPTLKDRKGFRIFQVKVGVYAKYHDFDSVLESEPYLDVGGSTSKEEFMRRGIDEETYQRHLNAWVYLSTAFELPTDIESFQRSSSPGKFWKETV